MVFEKNECKVIKSLLIKEGKDFMVNAKKEMPRYKAIFLLVATAVLWSTGGLLIKLIDLNPMAIAGMRSTIAAAVILIYLKRPRITWSKVQIAGAVTYAGTVLLFAVANKMTTAANAIILQYTAPIYVALFGAWFLGEKTTWIDWVTIVFVIAGMLLFFIDRVSAGGALGNILAIISGLCFAGTIMLMRKQKDTSSLESIFLGNILTALIGLPFMFKSVPDVSGWTGLFILGILQLGIPYIIYSVAIKHVNAMDAALVPVLEPILNPVWVFVVTGEMPGVWSLIGGAVVLFFITGRSAFTNLRKLS